MRLTRFAAATSAAIALSLVTPAQAVDLTGSLRAPSDYAANASRNGPRDSYWQEWNGVVPTRPARFDFVRDVAVVLVRSQSVQARVQAATLPTPPSEVTINLRGGSLVPGTFAVRPNAILKIQNNDDFSHSIFADDLSGFEAEATGAHQTRTVRVTATGRQTYALHDERVPHLKGYLHVVPDLIAVATVTPDGHYTFTDLPFAATFTVKVFYLDREIASFERTTNSLRSIVVDPIALDAPRGVQ